MTFLDKNIILFDGYCNFCDGFITFVLKNESSKSKCLFFCALSTNTGLKILNKRLKNKLEKDSIYYINKSGEVYSESDAIFKIINHLKIPYKILLIFKFFPKFLRDYFYRLFAKNRYKIFGKKNSCNIPSMENRARYL